MEPLIPESAEGVAKKNRRRNDEANFRIARRGDQGIWLGGLVLIFAVVVFVLVVSGHDENDLILRARALPNQLRHCRTLSQAQRPVDNVDEAVGHDSDENGGERGYAQRGAHDPTYW